MRQLSPLLMRYQLMSRESVPAAVRPLNAAGVVRVPESVSCSRDASRSQVPVRHHTKLQNYKYPCRRCPFARETFIDIQL